MTSALTLQSLPLFPLGTVLFPGGVLPLRIFEVRYLDMVRRCHKAGAPFGVVSLTQGQEVRLPGATEAFATVGTLAQIDSYETPRPGLMMIRISGTQRFRITQRSQLRHGLWIADVERVDPDVPVSVPEDLRGTSRALAKVVESLQQNAASAEEVPIQGPRQLNDCGWVANRWCELLPLPLQGKQRLMELENPLVRLEIITDLLNRTGIST